MPQKKNHQQEVDAGREEYQKTMTPGSINEEASKFAKSYKMPKKMSHKDRIQGIKSKIGKLKY